jgi:hypothetical protein
MAAAFVEADLSPLERGAALAGHLDHEPTDTRAMAELRAIEDRFGLSPLARRRLQWEIDTAPVVTSPASRPRRDTRLHAV